MSDDVGRRLAASLRSARTDLGLTQAEVAERAGMAVEAYARLERGGVIPLATTVCELSRALGVSADALLGTTERAASPAAVEKSEVRRLVVLANELEPRALRVLVAMATELHRGSSRSRKASHYPRNPLL